ncbi:MAG: peptidase [Leptolyngbya foveolarum]|uniref:Peptidase n=1 Tax=Leptolyngbya foveolarum TaxID=47253 RepID=A0A2W4UFE9_9CYAN|nr:MAG: peptidase [Leptolyngbya foveolarum]
MANYITKIHRRMRLAQLVSAWTIGLLAADLFGQAAYAYEVTFSPSSPQLGDTVAVVVQSAQSASAGTGMSAPTASAPTVSANGMSYQSFSIGGDRFQSLIPTSPLDSPGQLIIQVSGAEEPRSLTVNLSDRTFRTQRIWLPPGDNDLGTDEEFERVAAFKRLVTPERHWAGPLLRPSQGYVSTEYGVQRYYNGVFAEDYYHRGVDYAAATGSAVVSPAAGYVRLVGEETNGFELHGNTIGIDHGQGVLSIMIHLSRIDVKEGDFVTAGQVIGGVGSTGASTGPHLHWGLYVNGIAVDPVPWRDAGFE